MALSLRFNPFTGKLDYVSVEDLSGYLKLDQTTPQSVINGVPFFTLGLKTPKIYPNADSETAIQFNGANGTTNILTIDTANGRVKIGTLTTSVAKFSIGISDYFTNEYATPAQIGLGLHNTDTTDGSWSIMNFGIDNVSYYAGIGCQRDDVESFHGSLHFFVKGIGGLKTGLKLETTGNALIPSTQKLQFGDANTFISQVSSGIMKISPSNYMKLGGDTDYTKIANDGDLTFAGQAGYLVPLGGKAFEYTADGLTHGGFCLNFGGGSTAWSNSYNFTGSTNNNLFGVDASAPAIGIGIQPNPIVGIYFQSTGATSGSYAQVLLNSSSDYLFSVRNDGNVGIGYLSPTARLHIRAGSATANTAPLKFTSGTLLTVAEAGAIEFLTDDLYVTITTGSARKKIVLDDGTALTATRIPFATTNGRLTDDADLTFATDTLTATKVSAPTSVTTPLINATNDLTVTCGANKTLVLTQPVYKDINIAGALLSKPASSAPGTDTFRTSAVTDTGIETYAFAVGEKVHGGFELQHDYKEGTDLTFHVHYQIIAAPTGTDNVQWRLAYVVLRDGVTLTTVTTIDSADCAVDTRYRAYRCDFGDISGTNYKIGDQFMFTLTRVAADGDAFAGDALIGTAGIHYQVDTLGSRTIGTK
jgi:hypothetical protein